MVQPSIGRDPVATAEATLLVVGAASRDVDAHDPRGWRLGGTVSYGSLAAARLGVAVRALIGVDAEAAGAHEIETLRAAGVEVQLVPLARGPIFDNRQTTAGREQLVHEVSDVIPATEVPAEWRSTPTVLLGPVAGELGDDWASAFADDTFVALGWQGLLRGIVPGQPVERLPLARILLVERADTLLLSSEDTAAGGATLRDLLREGQRLIVTHNEHGAIALVLDHGRIYGRYVPAMSGKAVDTTGAGDVFLSAWLAARLLAPDAGDDRHLLVASASAGLSVAARSMAELPGKNEARDALLHWAHARKRVNDG